MIDSVSAPEQQPSAVPAADATAAPAAVALAEGSSATTAAPSPDADSAAVTSTDASVDAGAPATQGKSRRGGRGRRASGGATEGAAVPQSGASAASGSAAPAAPKGPRGQRPIPPTLEKLAELYPQHFGAVFLPLKRGIFQDLLAAHPEVFEREALKVALGIHTRSTRYLQSVAAGQPRHDLQGQRVEDMAPEHVHQALLEVYRRRQGRASDDLLPKLRNRMMAAFEASGLTREAYTELVQGRDEAANAILQEAFAEWSARNARDEALLRAFEASGQTLDAFADMYGMVARTVGQQLERARAVIAHAAKAADAAAAAAVIEPVTPDTPVTPAASASEEASGDSSDGASEGASEGA